MELLEQRIQNQDSIISKNNAIIEDLRVAKNKYEQISYLHTRQKEELEAQSRDNGKIVIDLQNEREVVKKKLQEMEIKLKFAESRLLCEREQAKGKVLAAQSSLEKSKASNTSFHKLSD